MRLLQGMEDAQKIVKLWSPRGKCIESPAYAVEELLGRGFIRAEDWEVPGTYNQVYDKGEDIVKQIKDQSIAVRNEEITKQIEGDVLEVEWII